MMPNLFVCSKNTHTHTLHTLLDAKYVIINSEQYICTRNVHAMRNTRKTGLTIRMRALVMLIADDGIVLWSLGLSCTGRCSNQIGVFVCKRHRTTANLCGQSFEEFNGLQAKPFPSGTRVCFRYYAAAHRPLYIYHFDWSAATASTSSSSSRSNSGV